MTSEERTNKQNASNVQLNKYIYNKNKNKKLHYCLKTAATSQYIV